ncbi:MAG: hypothetical protein AB8F95_17005 [Bacteroidia bacterium]
MRSQIHFLILAACLFASCAQEQPQEPLSEECLTLKKEAQTQFDQEHYSETIKLFRSFETCMDDQHDYLSTLALLYKINDQKALSHETFDRLLVLIGKSENLTPHDQAFERAGIYACMDDRQKLHQELRVIDRSELSEVQKETIRFWEDIVNQGEFVAVEMTVDFELFD